MKTWTFPERHPEPGGAWDDEPDKAQWVDEATGLDCLIVRNWGGALCGYVGLPPGHPLHGADYANCDDERLNQISVHGGLTFADFCQETGDESGVCHVPEPGRPEKVWWLGFDCAHAGDVSPRMIREYELAGLRAFEDSTYKTFDYVRAEVADLARQLAAVDK